MLTNAFTSRGRRILAQLAVGSAVLGAAALAGAATTGVFNHGSAPTDRPSFAVLNEPPTPFASGSPILQRVQGSGGVSAHLALDSNGAQLFAVTSNDGQFVCLTVRSDGGAADTCRTRDDLTTADVIWIRRSSSDGTFDVFGLAPDAVTSIKAGASVVHPMHNAFVIRSIQASVSDLVVDGPSVHSDVSLVPQPAATTTTTVGG